MKNFFDEEEQGYVLTLVSLLQSVELMLAKIRIGKSND